MKILIIVLILLAGIILYETYLTRSRISIGVKLADAAIPYEQQGSGLNILVIGDSTAVGTGASTAEFSIAGLVGKTFPDATIVNKGVNGAKTAELIDRLEEIEIHYDLIMVHIGGNDIVRNTDLEKLQPDISRVLELAKEKGTNVTLTTTGSMGTALLLPFGTRWNFTIRTRRVRAIFQDIAEEKEVVYNDLFREKDVDPFAKDPKKYYAADIFHPSDAGYADWYTIIEPGVLKAIK